MHQFALGPDAYARELLASRGYEDVRHFYEMAIELTERPALLDVEIESLQPGDEQAFYDALDASFQDHWEHHSSPFEEWWGRHTANPNFDPSLWFLIRSDGEIAAVARNEANRNGGGYVGALGVRREFRGHGYAKALLYRTFAEFWDRGMPRVTLGVDADESHGRDAPLRARRHARRVGEHRLREGARVNVRPFADADAPIVAELINRDEELFYGRPGHVTGGEILKYLPWSKEAWIWEEDGRILGSAMFSVAR